MTKAIFMDYTGTMVMEDEPYTRELLSYFVSHSDLKDKGEVLKVVWTMIKKLESESFDDAFIKNDDKVDIILEHCAKNYGLNGDLVHMHDIWRKIWVEAPLFDDVKPFFERSTLPIYIISNDDLGYLKESMALKGLNPAGIISAEMVSACKPHRRIFEKALEISGVKPDEVVLIGDSITSDVEAAKAVGIRPIYLSRSKDIELEGVKVIRSLDNIDFKTI
ncbi:MAG: HAD family hydrolase [Lachnospiraceae bacterium]|nr:HAD family hydrolase [Lachnospiraceae bacterium]